MFKEETLLSSLFVVIICIIFIGLAIAVFPSLIHHLQTHPLILPLVLGAVIVPLLRD
jgi:hypothetical protein